MIKPGLYYAVCNKEDDCYSNHTITLKPPYVKWIEFSDRLNACLFLNEEDAQITKVRIEAALLDFGLECNFHVTWKRIFDKELDPKHPDYHPDRSFDGVVLDRPAL